MAKVIDSSELMEHIGCPYRHLMRSEVKKALGIKPGDIVIEYFIPYYIIENTNVEEDYIVKETLFNLLHNLYKEGYYCEYGGDYIIKNVMVTNMPHEEDSKGVLVLMKGVKMQNE